MVNYHQKEFISKAKAELEQSGLNVFSAQSIEQAISFLRTNIASNNWPAVLFVEGGLSKILVVEDEENLLAVIKKGFERYGFSVLSARSVKQALSFLQRINDIKAIWLDHYLLGKETGLELLAKWKKQKRQNTAPPVFVVSNVSTLAERQIYNAFGVSRFFPKTSYTLSQIVEEIIQFLGQKQKVV